MSVSKRPRRLLVASHLLNRLHRFIHDLNGEFLDLRSGRNDCGRVIRRGGVLSRYGVIRLFHCVDFTGFVEVEPFDFGRTIQGKTLSS